jgi:hypothetical protein
MRMSRTPSPFTCMMSPLLSWPVEQGKDDTRLRFLIATDAALTAARLALVQATATIIASGFEIRGSNP